MPVYTISNGSRVELDVYGNLFFNSPQNIVATPGDAKVTFSFDPPTQLGQNTIDGYEVEIEGGPTVGGASSPIIVTGLTNGTVYQGRVRALGTPMDGAWSTFQYVTPEGALDGATFDNASVTDFPNATVHTVPYTIGGGTGRVLVVFLTQRRSPLRSTNSCTYNGTAGTSGGTITDAGNGARVEVFYWLEASLPAAGIYNVVATLSATSGQHNMVVLSFADAPQTAPLLETVTESGVSTVNLVETATAGSLAVAAMILDSDNATPADPAITGEQTAGPALNDGEHVVRSGYILSTDTSPYVGWSTTDVGTPTVAAMLTFQP